MTRLLLIRHGQASAGASDYDELSTLGRAQSRALGRWLAQRRSAPTHVLVGPRKRHRDTFAELAAGYNEACGIENDAPESLPERRAPRRLPAPIVIDELDEHHGIQLVTLLAPRWRERDDPLGEAARRALESPNGKTLVELLRLALPAWARGQLEHAEVEPWDAFLARAEGIAPRIAAMEGARNVWAVTSGGLVCALVGRALECSLERTLELMLATRNTAMTELSVRPGSRPGLALVSFNVLPHLDEAQITFV